MKIRKSQKAEVHEYLPEICGVRMESQVREKKIVAATSVGAAIFLTGTKLAIGLLTGSLGILAEAAHSALDLAAAVVTFFAVRVSDRPADESHLYGHGKIENLSALFETLLLLVTCLWIIYEAIHRLFFVEVKVDPSLWAFLVMGMSIIIDLSRSRALARVAKKYKSQALEADALHFSTDIWSSAVVIVGLALVKIGEYTGSNKAFFEHADAIAALVVAVIVVYVSLKLGRRAVDALLDRAPTGLAERISRLVGDIDGIRHVTHIRVRDVGNRVFVDLTVDVPRRFSFEESHQIVQKAEDAVRSLCPNADVVIHADPIAEREGIPDKINAVAAREHASVHNITTYWTDKGMWINLDLEVDPGYSLKRAHELATDFENRLQAELIGEEASTSIADIAVHIEPRSNESVHGTPMDPIKANAYIQRIEAIGRELKGSDGIHQIDLHEVNGCVYLTLHLLICADISIAEVHNIAEEMERHLRLEFPELGRVVIHTEPSSR
jgi:cation diffusion facilitator family transporter